jgi:hypothetical protein
VPLDPRRSVDGHAAFNDWRDRTRTRPDGVRGHGTDAIPLGDGETRTRTGDTTIFSRVLYQLSYLAVVEA